MKPPHWLTFGLALLFMLIKFTIVSYQEHDFMMELYGGYSRLTLLEYYRLLLIRKTFLESSLILVSLSGFAIRNANGHILANLFPYFILVYGFFHLFEPTQLFATYHIGQITFALSVIVLTNTKSAAEIFGLSYKSSRQRRTNMRASLWALALVLVLLSWIELSS